MLVKNFAYHVRLSVEVEHIHEVQTVKVRQDLKEGTWQYFNNKVLRYGI